MSRKFPEETGNTSLMQTVERWHYRDLTRLIPMYTVLLLSCWWWLFVVILMNVTLTFNTCVSFVCSGHWSFSVCVPYFTRTRQGSQSSVMWVWRVACGWGCAHVCVSVSDKSVCVWALSVTHTQNNTTVLELSSTERLEVKGLTGYSRYSLGLRRDTAD